MKNFKDNFIGLTFIALIVAGLVYLSYNEITNWTSQSTYFFYFLITVIIYISIIGLQNLKKGENENASMLSRVFFFDAKFNTETTFFLCLFGIPFFLAVVGLAITIINNIYILLSLYLIITLLIFITISGKVLIKLIAFLLLGIILYSGFKAKDIFKLDVKVIYDNHKIYDSGSSYEDDIQLNKYNL